MFPTLTKIWFLKSWNSDHLAQDIGKDVRSNFNKFNNKFFKLIKILFFLKIFCDKVWPIISKMKLLTSLPNRNSCFCCELCLLHFKWFDFVNFCIKYFFKFRGHAFIISCGLGLREDICFTFGVFVYLKRPLNLTLTDL